MTDRPTFSPFWHRVRAMKPRLRSHVDITRQHYRGRRWHVVHDPTSNQFYRLNPIAYDFIASLDGQRDVETAWQNSLTKFGDAAPTQNEIIQLISQLYTSNLLSVDSTPETEQLLQRGRDRLKQKAIAQAVGIMYLRIKIFNPDRLVTTLEPIVRPVLNRVGFAAWCVLVVWALAILWPHWSRLASGLDTIMSPGNLWLLPLVFICTKAWHEFGHGVICKRFGGQVPEFGTMLLVLLPSPYVDASAAWSFKSKWQRIAVGAGGMMFELFLAALSAFVWVWAQNTGRSGELVSQIAYNVMITSGVSTVLFNANPLMRFDGYYMLADLLETPNLYQRSTKQLTHYIQKYVFRLRNLTPPTTQTGERVVLTTYGILAGAYRIFLFISITLFIMGQFFALGLVLAIWTAAAWFIMPVGKLIHWLASAPALSDKRGRAIGWTIGMAAVALIVLGLIPMPDRRFGSGIIESPARTGVFVATDGFVLTAHKKPGERVEKGDPIITMENPDLTESRRALLFQIEQYRVQERAAMRENQAAAAALAAERVSVAMDNLREIDQRVAELVVTSPISGVVVRANPEDLVGAFAKRGQPICEVVDTDHLRVAATLDQRQGAWLFEKNGSGDQNATTPAPFVVDMRLHSNVSTVISAGRVEVAPAGRLDLPSAALGFRGGGTIETEGKDESGRVAKRPQFNVRIHASVPEQLVASCSPGERVLVRFKLPPRPLLSQWLDRLEKEIQARVHL